MKTNEFKDIYRHYGRELEKAIGKKDKELKDLTRKNGKHFAQSNLPTGNKLLPFIGEIKAGYEELCSRIRHYLQPKAHSPEAKIESNSAKEKDKALLHEIFSLQDRIRIANYERSGTAGINVIIRICLAVIATGIIATGEIAFNLMAFEVVGENKFMALLIAISATFTAFALSLCVPAILKNIQPVKRKILMGSGIFIFTLLFFIVLAVFRSMVVQKHGLTISPAYWVDSNL